jgi:hypothetical protein
MLQTLDLARENAALKLEVARLRQEVARLAHARRLAPLAALRKGRPAQIDVGDDDPRARLMLIVPRSQSNSSRWNGQDGDGLPAPGSTRLRCDVIVDRRVTERRCGHANPPPLERRRSERRGVNGSASPALVVTVVPRRPPALSMLSV